MQTGFGKFFDGDSINDDLNVVFKIGTLVQFEQKIVNGVINARNDATPHDVALPFIERGQRFLQLQQSGRFVSTGEQSVAMRDAFVAQIFHQELAETLQRFESSGIFLHRPKFAAKRHKTQLHSIALKCARRASQAADDAFASG